MSRARRRVGVGRRHPAPPGDAGKAPVYTPLYNWTGFYVGINGGGGWGRSEFTGAVPRPAARSTPRAVSSAAPSATTGRWARSCSALKATSTGAASRAAPVCAGTSCETRNDWLGTARGRLGYAFDRFMPYVTGGAAFGNIKTNVAGVGSADEYARRLDRRRRRRIRPRRAVDHQGRISLRRSRRWRVGAWLDRELPHQHRARRLELPLLIAVHCVKAKSPGACSGAFSFAVASGRDFGRRESRHLRGERVEPGDELRMVLAPARRQSAGRDSRARRRA